jgi:adenylate kinase
MLSEQGLRLNAVIELQVDQDALVGRIVHRAVEARAAGQPVRKDDDPEVFKTRLQAYNRDTAAVTPFYGARGQLTTIDGMKPIADVAAAIDKVLVG